VQFKTLIHRVKGQQCFVNHAHDYFYVAVSSCPEDTSQELTIKRISSKQHQEGLLSGWDAWNTVWPTARSQSLSPRFTTANGFNDRYILDDYDIFENHILIYARDKKTHGDISIQLLKIDTKLCNVTTPKVNIVTARNDETSHSLDHVIFLKEWTGKDFQVLLESKYKHHITSASEEEVVTGAYVWTVTPGTNGNFSATTARFSLSSTLIPGDCHLFAKKTKSFELHSILRMQSVILYNLYCVVMCCDVLYWDRTNSVNQFGNCRVGE
jgi:hypothetical protein